jgi:hypothetical protein
MQPRFGTERAGGASSSELGMLVCAAMTGQLPGLGTITARRCQAFLGTDTVVTAGPGCGSPGTIVAQNRPFSVGNPSFRFLLNGAPPGALAFLSIGFPGNELVCGLCVLTNPVAIQYVPTINGGHGCAMPVSCNPAFVGLNLSAQWLVFGTPPTPCPQAPGLSATDRLHLTLGL